MTSLILYIVQTCKYIVIASVTMHYPSIYGDSKHGLHAFPISFSVSSINYMFPEKSRSELEIMISFVFSLFTDDGASVTD